MNVRLFNQLLVCVLFLLRVVRRDFILNNYTRHSHYEQDAVMSQCLAIKRLLLTAAAATQYILFQRVLYLEPTVPPIHHCYDCLHALKVTANAIVADQSMVMVIIMIKVQ